MILRAALVWLLLTALPATAQQGVAGQAFGVRAAIVESLTGLSRQWGGAAITLGLSQPVPYRAYTLVDPRRIVLDFREVDFSTLPRERLQAALVDGRRVTGLRAGPYREGWSRLVLQITEPLAIKSLALQTDEDSGAAQLRLQLERVSGEEFAALSGPALSDAFPQAAAGPVAVPNPERRAGALRVLLDPGHGGVDPGAVAGDVHEADIVLSFARAARDALRRRGHEVVLTRDADVFVSLEGRIVAARDAQADLMISIHADALEEGFATGAQIYTLSPEASSEATRLLAERHSRDDLLSGADLSAQDDTVASALMDIARRETAPRTDALANALVDAFRAGGVRLHKRPREDGAFSVLKAPDMPAVLLELGFMSSRQDLERLVDPTWRANTAEALAAGVDSWRARDATLRALRRQ